MRRLLLLLVLYVAAGAAAVVLHVHDRPSGPQSARSLGGSKGAVLMLYVAGAAAVGTVCGAGAAAVGAPAM